MGKNRRKHKENKEVEKQSVKKTWWDRVKIFLLKNQRFLLHSWEQP